MEKGQTLSKELYKSFQSCQDYSFKNQIQRANVSVSNNIAEGFERQTNKEFKYFLYVAKGSAGEVQSMLHLALELAFINQATFDQLYLLTTDISKLISGFIKSIERNST